MRKMDVMTVPDNVPDELYLKCLREGTLSATYHPIIAESPLALGGQAAKCAAGGIKRRR